MRNLTVTICLVLAVLLGSAGCVSEMNGYYSNVRLGRSDQPLSVGTYSGYFINHKPHGLGTYLWSDGQKYVGEYRDGKRHGQGTMTWAVGSKYVGEWRNDKRHGRGTMTWDMRAMNTSAGEKFVGEWEEDEFHGRGIYTNADGSVAESVWEQGKKISEQIVTPPSGKTTEAMLWRRATGAQRALLEQQRALKVQKGEMDRLKEKCSEFGFKDGSKEMSTCMFELYKLNKSAKQFQPVTNTRNTNNVAQRALLEQQRALLEQQRQEREFREGMELMKQGLEIMKPPQSNTSDGFRIGPKGRMWQCRSGICTE